MEFAFDLVKNYGKERPDHPLLRQARVIVVPVVNVDGFDLSRTDGEYVDLRELNENDPPAARLGPGHARAHLHAQELPGRRRRGHPRRQLRAHRSPAPAASASASTSTATTAGSGAVRARPDRAQPEHVEAGPADPTYRGASAFSEPETQNIRDLVASRQMTMMISNHTFSNLVLRPNGVNPNTIGADGKPVGDAPDEARTQEAGCQDGVRRTATPTSTAGSSTTPPGPPRTGPTTPPAASATPSRSAPTSSTRRTPRSSTSTSAGQVRRQGQPRGLPDRPRARRRHALPRHPQGQGPEGRDAPAGEELQHPHLGGLVQGRREHRDQGRAATALRVDRQPVDPAGGAFAPLRGAERRAVPQGGHRGRTDSEPDEPRRPRVRAERPADVCAGPALDWPTPDDLDLEVYRKTSDGEADRRSAAPATSPATRSGSTSRRPGRHLRPAGDQLRLGDAELHPHRGLFDSVTRHTAGKRERYTLTCEKNGKVLQTAAGLHQSRRREVDRPLGVPPQVVTRTDDPSRESRARSARSRLDA